MIRLPNFFNSMFEVRFPICIAVLLLFPAGPLILTAQPTGIEQSSEVLTVPTGDKFLRWHGHAGRTYFVQVSDTTTPLAKWRWATVIERGDDEDISYEVDATASSGFFRLRYTDQFVAPDEWLEFADFDGDGLVNIDEIDPQSSAAATDPLSRDTDSDGMDDAYESRYGFDGSNPDENGNGTPDGQDDSDGDGLSNVEEGTLGTNPTFEDSDDDGELDGAEVAGGSDPLDEVKALRPGTYSVTGVRGEAGPNGLPSVGEGGDTVFYEKITYTNDLTSSSSGTDGGGSTSYSATSNYIQNSEWTRSPLETLGNISSWTWTKEDHQEGSFDSTQTRNDAEGQLEFSEVLSFACSRDLTPLTTIAVSGSKVTTQPPGGPVTSTASRAFPLIEEGLSVPNDAEPETPSGSDPTVRKWSRTHADGDGE